MIHHQTILPDVLTRMHYCISWETFLQLSLSFRSSGGILHWLNPRRATFYTVDSAHGLTNKLTPLVGYAVDLHGKEKILKALKKSFVKEQII